MCDEFERNEDCRLNDRQEPGRWPERFSRVARVIRQGIVQNLHSCVQIYVSLDEETVLNHAAGEAAPGVLATESTWMLWRSAGKPLTAAAVLKLQEQGRLSIDDELIVHLPNARRTVFERLTIRQLLTHSAGLPLIDTRWPDADWDSIIDGILSAKVPLRENYFVYQPQATWFLLGEIVRRCAGAGTYQNALERVVLKPAGLEQCRCGCVAADAGRRRSAMLLERIRRTLRPSMLSGDRAMTAASPGGNMRGPVHQLGRFYEILLRGGRTSDGRWVLSDSTVRHMTRRHRSGAFDHGLRHRVDMGLGCIINSQHHGPLVPYGYGCNATPDTFGHGGAQCAMGFCDPVHRLVVAWAANGLCGEPRHQKRNRDINDAVYHDLNLVAVR